MLYSFWDLGSPDQGLNLGHGGDSLEPKPQENFLNFYFLIHKMVVTMAVTSS